MVNAVIFGLALYARRRTGLRELMANVGKVSNGKQSHIIYTFMIEQKLFSQFCCESEALLHGILKMDHL